MRDVLKSFYFRKKSRCVRKNFLFILSNYHGNAFLWNNLSGKSLRIAISPIKRWKYKKIWLGDDFSQCIIILLSFLLLLFGWDVCFIITLALLERKASSTMMLHNAISLKLVVGTYMGGATSVYNGKNILGVPLGLSFQRIPPWFGLWKVHNM